MILFFFYNNNHTKIQMEHENGLLQHCRVCGGRLQKARGKNVAPLHSCAKNRDGLCSAFQIDVTEDSPQIQPAKFCNSCYMVMQRYRVAAENRKHYKWSQTVFQWEEHSPECRVSRNTQLKSIDVHLAGNFYSSSHRHIINPR